jgi:protein-L-isoaspartate O-methyltransferase
MQVPEALTQQLVNDGIMLFPFDDGNDQTLMQITKTSEGLISEALEKVSFVPLLPGLG